MRAHTLAKLLLQQPNRPIRFTDGTGDILRVGLGPYLEEEPVVWVDLHRPADTCVAASPTSVGNWRQIQGEWGEHFRHRKVEGE
jgi:hypothetical protein